MWTTGYGFDMHGLGCLVVTMTLMFLTSLLCSKTLCMGRHQRLHSQSLGSSTRWVIIWWMAFTLIGNLHQDNFGASGCQASVVCKTTRSGHLAFCRYDVLCLFLLLKFTLLSYSNNACCEFHLLVFSLRLAGVLLLVLVDYGPSML